MIGFRWRDASPKDLNDEDLAEEFGATWEGNELVTYALDSLVWQMEHMSDDYMYDND